MTLERSLCGWLLCATLLLPIAGSAARSRKVSVHQTAPGGVVTYVLGERAYLSLGELGGLREGAVLKLKRRNGQRTCRVEAVAEHTSVCIGRGIAAGDRFDAPGAGPRARAARPLERLPTASELRRQADAVASATLEKVRVDEDPRAVRMRLDLARVALHHHTFIGHGLQNLERLDLSATAEVLRGLRASADLSVLAWLPRGRQRSVVEVLVRRAELSGGSGDLHVAGGRTLLRYTPMLPMVDGATASLTALPNGGAVGAYAGLLPRPIDLAPRLDAWAAGAFVSQPFEGPAGSSRGGRVEARAGAATSDGAAPQGDVALSGGAWLGPEQYLSGAAHYGTRSGLTSARADVRARVTPWLPIHVAGRYLDARAGTVIGPAQLDGRRTLHLSGAAGLDVSFAELTGLAGAASDLTDPSTQSWLGAEVALRTGLLTRSVLTLGRDEAFGWLRQHTTHFAVLAFPQPGLRVSLRGALVQTPGSIAELPSQATELGLSGFVDAQLTPSVWLNVSGVVRSDLTPRPLLGPARPPEVGVVRLGVTGML